MCQVVCSRATNGHIPGRLHFWDFLPRVSNLVSVSRRGANQNHSMPFGTSKNLYTTKKTTKEEGWCHISELESIFKAVWAQRKEHGGINHSSWSENVQTRGQAGLFCSPRLTPRKASTRHESPKRSPKNKMLKTSRWTAWTQTNNTNTPTSTRPTRQSTSTRRRSSYSPAPGSFGILHM